MKKIILIGYSGHAFVAADIIQCMQHEIIGYCDASHKNNNPFKLAYFGKESEVFALQQIELNDYFIGIGNNSVRMKIQNSLSHLKHPMTIVHPSSVRSNYCNLGMGVMVGAQATINAFSVIGDGVILNTSCTIEHECNIGDFSHIAPGAVLAGNVKVGQCCFIGANSVIKQGISIGNNVTIGAGSVVIRDVHDGMTIVGNPAKPIKSRT